MAQTVRDEGSGCLIWTGPTSGDGRGGGYPRMKLDGQTVAVHRVLFTHYHGYIPGKKQIDHRCNNRLCLEIEHHQMMTHKRNQKLRDARRKALAIGEARA
ncbi:MAG: HNH endonuclease signature motif containing protein [Phyllobacterium sp.]